MDYPVEKTRTGCKYDLYRVYVRPGHYVYKIVHGANGRVAQACTTVSRSNDLFDLYNRCPADKNCGETCYDR